MEVWSQCAEVYGGRVNMEAEERQRERQRVWKNKRRASLYDLRDSNIGFMYRKKPDEHEQGDEHYIKPELNRDQLQKPSSSHSPNTVLLPAPPTPHDESLNISATGAKDLKREAIMKRDYAVFVQSLKTDLEGSVVEGKENEFSQIMDSLLSEPTESDYELYKAALEQPEFLPMDESSTKIVRLKQLMQKFDLEIEEWKSLIERKRNEPAHVESMLDQGQLEALLSDEELKMFRQPLVNWQYCEDMERELNQQNASLDAELRRISDQSNMIMKLVREEQQQYTMFLQSEETPRTLVQSLKRTFD